MELGLHRDQYDALVEALTAEGHDVELVVPVEERFGLPGVEVVADLVVYVVDQGKELATDALLLELARRLAGRRRRRRRAEVRRGSEPPREVDLPGPEEE